MKSITDTRRLNIIKNLIAPFGPCNVEEFQRWKGLTIDGVFGQKSYEALFNHLLKPIDVNFYGNYFLTEFNKSQMVFHWTHGWDNARGVFDWWKNDKVKHVATPGAINDQGEYYRGFDEKFWAHHIGCKNRHFTPFNLPNINSNLNRSSVGLEICNWGPLIKNNDGTYTPVGYEGKIKIKSSDIEVVELNYRGYKHFEKIKDAEIATAKNWALLMSIRFDIPIDYDHAQMWQQNSKALTGAAGMYSHGSYRDDKCDIHPQPEFIEMLKSLKSYENTPNS